MAAGHCRSLSWMLGTWTLFIWMTTFNSQVLADDTQYVTYTTDEGTVYLDDNRQPALYTGNYGDCQGDSLINVTRFDASLYRDNLTVMFHMAGTTALEDEHVMMFFSVFAYGENRFNLTFNPCVINIPTLCPLNASVPIEANGLIPIGPADVAGIPSVAFSIPDFEGQAILRLFSNTTKSQIACYSAVLKNGNSFSHPAVVGSILGLFTMVALVASIAVTIYGQFVPETRTHYAHSLSVFVVFSVLQHIFFTGSLSMNWPSVLVAFWSNYAWAAGMIYSRKMQNSINQFIGTNRGNISMVGSAPSNQNFADLGGGFSLSQIYKRNTGPAPFSAPQLPRGEHMLQRRALVNSSTGFIWYGDPVTPGLPLPGNYSGFAGTLAALDIPASNAFLTGLLWLLILIALIAATIVALKWIVEALAKLKLLKTTRLSFFRKHWVHFTGAAVLRICFIAFFMMMYLTLFQFALGGGKGAIAIAAVVLAVFLIGMFGISAYAIWYRLHRSKFKLEAGKLQFVSRGQGLMTRYGVTRESSGRVNEQSQRVVKNLKWWQPHFEDNEETQHVHDDEKYITKFGWLSSRFRRSKWWFFSAWLVYELVRAGFYGGAAGHPLTQVFGLLAWETIAFVAVVVMRPFESNRLNLLMVYCLGFSKVATVALSCAFDPHFGLSRILTTVIGVMIIVIQGVLTICLMIAIVLGAVSSYMSLMRNHEEFKPISWIDFRSRYFAHIRQKATDKPRPPPPPPPPEPEKPEGPYFSVSAVRREPKIEDEDPDKEIIEEVHEVEETPDQIEKPEFPTVPNYPYMSRANSIRSSTTNLPYGARVHRRSWSIKDLTNQSTDLITSATHSRMSIDSVRDVPLRYRAASLIEPSPNNMITSHGNDWQTRRHRRVRSSSNPLRHQRSSNTTLETDEIKTIQPREE